MPCTMLPDPLKEKQPHNITDFLDLNILGCHHCANNSVCFIIQLFRMFQKVPLIRMGHPNVRGSVISLYSPLGKNV